MYVAFGVRPVSVRLCCVTNAAFCAVKVAGEGSKVAPELLASFEGRRAERLDSHADGFSPIDTQAWSASGATR